MREEEEGERGGGGRERGGGREEEEGDYSTILGRERKWRPGPRQERQLWHIACTAPKAEVKRKQDERGREGSRERGREGGREAYISEE